MTSIIRRWSRPVRIAVLPVLFGITALAMTACGSTSGTSSSSTTANTSSALSAADKLAAQWSQRPAQIPVTAASS